MRWLAGIALFGLSLCALVAREAQACVRPAPVEFSIDARARGLYAPPPAPTNVTATASRSSGTFFNRDGLCTTSSCGGGGSLQVEFAMPPQGQRPVGELGYVLRLVEGEVPADVQASISSIAVGASP